MPDLLRSILEDTLSQPASPQALDNFLPRIRDIIINLLHGLKKKQSKLRSKPGTKDATSSKATTPARQGSVTSDAGLSQMLEDVPSQAPSRTESRHDSIRSSDDPSYLSSLPSLPPGDRASSINRHSLRRGGSQNVPKSDSSSTMSSATANSIPVLPPYTDPEQPTTQQVPQITMSNEEIVFAHPPPPPPPKQQDALTALQRGGDLERRASRRFSAYQIQKHLGTSPNGIPMIPPAQNSPIPNRGKEARESMTAVKSRSVYGRNRGHNRMADVSPNRAATAKPPRIIEEREDTPVLTLETAPRISPPMDTKQDDSPIAKTPDEFRGQTEIGPKPSDAPAMEATVSGPMAPVPEELLPSSDITEAPSESVRTEGSTTIENLENTPATVERKRRANVTPPPSHAVDLGSSPPQSKELTLFLQYKSKIKKFVLSEGYGELTIARLQLAFIEKFAWNTQSNGADLPEIYLQDPVSGVRYELEDLSDVKDRSVLVLNVEILDEVKKHFDEGIGGLQKTLDGVKSVLDGQGGMMQRFADRQLEASKEMARISAAPTPLTARAPTLMMPKNAKLAFVPETTRQEVQNLRRDIAVLRQTYSSMSSDFSAAMSDIKTKAANVKAVAAEASLPSYEGDAGRAHINKGKKTLLTDSESLVNRVDDLSDLVEDLRKDVVTRGVRPLPRQLENISKEISQTAKDLAKMKEFMRREKPVWTKIWEQELNLVCTERDELTQQEDLMADLGVDLGELTNVFTLVEEATKQQNLQNPGPGSLRSVSRSIAIDTEVDPKKAKDGVLGEVRALQPNHEDRLEAIARAEKARQRELESRKGGEFQREVANFVEEGKLKKTGGMDEVERMRKIKDERARKENWERANARQAELESKRAEAVATTAAITENASNNNEEGSTSNTAQDDANDTSQEGEAAFQDATEHKILGDSVASLNESSLARGSDNQVLGPAAHATEPNENHANSTGT